MAIYVWEGLPDGVWPCPNACGGITEDPYGGPCNACWDKVPRGCGNCGGLVGIGGEPGCRCTMCGMCEEPTLTPVDGLCPSCAEESVAGPFDGYDDEDWDEPIALRPGEKPRSTTTIHLPGDDAHGR